MEYLFKLEAYKSKASRGTCPSCQKPHCFAKYVNSNTGEYVSPIVGRCNREVNCGYHYKPKEYFTESNISLKPTSAIHTKPPIKKVAYIPFQILENTLNNYEQNSFVQFLIKILGFKETVSLIGKYFVGSSNDCYRKETGHWTGATIFWFIDLKGRIRAGQVKLFDDTGHTAKYIDRDGNTASCTDGIHTPLKWSYKKKNEALPEWLTLYIEGKKIFCFFGEHLLKDTTKPVAIVEAPKTAIIASAYIPEFIWIAVGALSYLTEERCKVLAGRNVALYPDLNAYDKWNKRALEFSHLANFKISDYLETIATDEERQQGLDLADFLIRYDFDKYTFVQEFPSINSIAA